MNFQTSNGVYSINWKYTMVGVNVGKKTVAREKTDCSLSKDQKQLCHASITRYHKDVFDKKIARKNTMKGVLQILPKSIRQEIWNAYLTNTGKRKKETVLNNQN